MQRVERRRGGDLAVDDGAGPRGDAQAFDRFGGAVADPNGGGNVVWLEPDRRAGRQTAGPTPGRGEDRGADRLVARGHGDPQVGGAGQRGRQMALRRRRNADAAPAAR